MMIDHHTVGSGHVLIMINYAKDRTCPVRTIIQ